MRRLAPMLVLVCVVGCTASQKHRYAVSSQVVASAIFAIQDAEDALFTAQRITPAQHQRFNTHLLIALTLGKEFNTAVRGWQPGQPVPQQLAALRQALFNMTVEIAAGWPEDAKTQLLQTINATYDAVLAVLMAGGQ